MTSRQSSRQMPMASMSATSTFSTPMIKSVLPPNTPKTPDSKLKDPKLITPYQIRYFLEPSSVSPATDSSRAKLLVPPSQSINKIGHALAILDPIFRRHTLESDKIRGLAKELGEHEDPRVLQSMIICKQPRIGGQGKLLFT